VERRRCDSLIAVLAGLSIKEAAGGVLRETSRSDCCGSVAFRLALDRLRATKMSRGSSMQEARSEKMKANDCSANRIAVK